MSKDAIMSAPDGYVVRLFGTVQKDDLEWASLTGRWQPVHSSLIGHRIEYSLPTPMVARRRREHD